MQPSWVRNTKSVFYAFSRLHYLGSLRENRHEVVPALKVLILNVFMSAKNTLHAMTPAQPRIILLFSGKRKSGKDYVTDLLQHR